MGSQGISSAADGVVGDVRRVRHAAALCGFGGALEFRVGAKVPLMINCPPQHGQGGAMVLGK